MMPEYNIDEQTRIDHYEALQKAFDDGSKYVNKGQVEQARQIAENMKRNAATRERMKAERDAETKAQHDKIQARHDAKAKGAQDEFLTQARGRYPGTEAEWEKDKGEILRLWKIQQALGEDEDVIARKRALYGNFL